MNNSVQAQEQDILRALEEARDMPSQFPPSLMAPEGQQQEEGFLSGFFGMLNSWRGSEDEPDVAATAPTITAPRITPDEAVLEEFRLAAEAAELAAMEAPFTRPNLVRPMSLTPTSEFSEDALPAVGGEAAAPVETTDTAAIDAAVAQATGGEGLMSRRFNAKGLTPVTETSHAQRRLFELGYVEVGTADGVAGRNTRSAVRRYQRQNDLPVTGQLDLDTLDSLTGADADLDTIVQRQIAHHEGQRNYPYKDSKGLWTIGIGHLIGNGSDRALQESGYSQYSAANPMPDDEVADLFREDLEEHKRIAERYPFYADMSEEGKRAILDLTFNMGDFYNKKKADGTYVWANLRTQLQNGEWEAAANNLANSAYARQVGQRATTVTNLLRQAGD